MDVVVKNVRDGQWISGTKVEKKKKKRIETYDRERAQRISSIGHT